MNTYYNTFKCNIWLTPALFGYASVYCIFEGEINLTGNSSIILFINTYSLPNSNCSISKFIII